MASVACDSETQVCDNFNYTKVSSIPQCICCQHLQIELQTVQLELQTAKKIIELLHEETNSTALGTYTNSQSTNTPSTSSAIHSDLSKENATNKWNTITSTKRKHIKQSVVQQQQPIPTIVNRYVLPNIQHTNSEDSQSSGISEVKTSTKLKTHHEFSPL
jgi:hypothetical protein